MTASSGTMIRVSLADRHRGLAGYMTSRLRLVVAAARSQ